MRYPWVARRSGGAAVLHPRQGQRVKSVIERWAHPDYRPLLADYASRAQGGA